MKRKDYRIPTMKVVKLRHAGMLMVSGPAKKAAMEDYEVKDTQDW